MRNFCLWAFAQSISGLSSTFQALWKISGSKRNIWLTLQKYGCYWNSSQICSWTKLKHQCKTLFQPKGWIVMPRIELLDFTKSQKKSMNCSVKRVTGIANGISKYTFFWHSQLVLKELLGSSQLTRDCCSRQWSRGCTSRQYYPIHIHIQKNGFGSDRVSTKISKL